MKLPLSWIREFVEVKTDFRNIAYDLTMLGFEVEGYEPWGDDDTILDISITPNRGDCLSVIGLARELSAHYNIEHKEPEIYKGDGEGTSPDITVEDIEGCPRYIGWTLSDVKNSIIPEIIAYRLDACGLRSVNIIVDITNYILIEMGQPLHAFDLDRLSGEKIIVRRARTGESIKLLDGSNVNLSTEDLVIADAKKPVAIAGVMGGLETEVGSRTKRILLESATFDYRSIRRTSKRHHITTPASYRFERTVGYSSTDTGSRRALFLMLKYGAISSTSKPEDTGRGFKQKKIYFDFSNISALIGQDIDSENITEKLKKIGIEIKTGGGKSYAVPPDTRPDLEREADILEEVARLTGYDNIASTIPSGAFKPPEHDPIYLFSERLRNILNSMRLYENESFSFTGKSQLSHLGYDIDGIDDLIKVRNPISEDTAYLRKSLTASLISAVIYNHRRDIGTVPLYEIAKVYYQQEGKFQEETMLGIVIYGNALPRTWLSKDEKFSIHHIKGIIEAFIDELGITDYKFEEGNHELVDEGSHLSILIKGKQIGFLGKVRDEIRSKMKLGDDIFISEMNIRPLMENEITVRKFTITQHFPSVFRDLSIIANEEIKTGDIMKTIIDSSDNLIVDMVLYDVYKGKSIPKEKKGFTFALTFQSSDRTLTDDEVNQVIENIIINLKEKFGIVLRSK